MDSNESTYERPNTRFPIIAVVISALITVFLGLVGITYSGVEKQIDTKASKESVVLIEQKIESQLETQNLLLRDLKQSQNEMVLLYMGGKVK